MLGAVERALAGDRSRTVILDAQNNIKGYRYQLFCLARAASAPHALVECHLLKQPSEDAWYKHAEKIAWSVLADRYEAPNEDTRWDSPLFHAYDGDVEAGVVEGLRQAFSGGARESTSLATRKTQPTSSPGSTQAHSIVDNVLQEICQQILQAIQLRSRFITLPYDPASQQPKSESVKLELTPQWSGSFLQRLRRDFMHANRNRPIVDASACRRLFLDYLQAVASNKL